MAKVKGATSKRTNERVALVLQLLSMYYRPYQIIEMFCKKYGVSERTVKRYLKEAFASIQALGSQIEAEATGTIINCLDNLLAESRSKRESDPELILKIIDRKVKVMGIAQNTRMLPLKIRKRDHEDPSMENGREPHEELATILQIFEKDETIE